jgi:hypothetical protein
VTGEPQEAGVAADFEWTRARRAAGAVACAAGVLFAANVAGAKPPPPPPAPKPPKGVNVTEAPYISGDARVGSTLAANGGAWTGPKDTQTKWEWWRCPTPASVSGCADVAESTASYTLTASDLGQYIVLVLYVWHDQDAAYGYSAPTAQIAPALTAGATPTPAPAPPPPPPFEATPAPTPAPAPGAVLGASATRPKLLQPFPVVRMRGRLTLLGAQVTLLSVRAPRHVRILVHCAGTGCPQTRWQRTATRQRLTRIGAFERNLISGMRITVSVTRRGYIGKRTTFWIRRGRVPRRTDGCLTSAGRTVRCPAAAR